MKQTATMLTALRKLVLIAGMVVSLSIAAAAQSIDFKVKAMTVQNAVMELQKKFGYSVVVRSNEIDISKPISIDLTGKSIEEIVAAIFAGQDVEVNVSGKNIIVAKSKPAAKVEMITVTGIVRDETGQPAIGAAVFQKGNTANGVITSLDGEYSITVPSNSILLVSYIG